MFSALLQYMQTHTEHKHRVKSATCGSDQHMVIAIKGIVHSKIKISP